MLTLVTQNVDELHELGGHGDVIHMHGEALKTRCDSCGHVERWTGELSVATPCPICTRPGGLRPACRVVRRDADVHGADLRGARAALTCSPPSAPPARSIPPPASRPRRGACGVPTVEINLEPSETASVFDERLYGPATETVPAWVERLLSSHA